MLAHRCTLHVETAHAGTTWKYTRRSGAPSLQYTSTVQVLFLCMYEIRFRSCMGLSQLAKQCCSSCMRVAQLAKQCCSGCMGLSQLAKQCCNSCMGLAQLAKLCCSSCKGLAQPAKLCCSCCRKISGGSSEVEIRKLMLCDCKSARTKSTLLNIINQRCLCNLCEQNVCAER